MGLTEVSNILWRERELLELLTFKLEEEQLLLAAGRARWLARATREVEIVLEEIRRAELGRSVEVDALGAELGLGPNPSLNALAGAVGSPWNEILLEHRRAFLEATNEITALAASNKELLTAGYQAARDMLLAVNSEPQLSAYTQDGRAATAPVTRFRLLDEAI